MSESYDEKQLKKIEEELLKQMDQSIHDEEHLIERSKEIGAKLSLSPSTKEEIDGKVYTFSYRTMDTHAGKSIFMMVADEFKYQIALDKYKPYMINAEINNDLSLKENLTAIVESFLRHVFDMVVAEEL